MSDEVRTISVPAVVAELETLRQFFAATAKQLGADQSSSTDLLVALNEAATNIIVHGYKGRSGTIELLICSQGADLKLQLRDWAPLFDPTTVPPPQIDLPLEQRAPGGMGVHLTRHFSDDMLYRVTPDGGNELTLVKRGVLAAPKEYHGGDDG